MGKNNRNGKRPQRYTGKNVDHLGDPLRMERHAVDIFRDMSRSRYNINNLSEFQNQDFVMACIRASQQQVRQNQIVLNALRAAYQGLSASDPDVIGMTNKFQMLVNGWSKVYTTMYSFYNTGDLGSIIGLVGVLSSSRDLRL